MDAKARRIIIQRALCAGAPHLIADLCSQNERVRARAIGDLAVAEDAKSAT